MAVDLEGQTMSSEKTGCFKQLESVVLDRRGVIGALVGVIAARLFRTPMPWRWKEIDGVSHRVSGSRRWRPCRLS